MATLLAIAGCGGSRAVPIKAPEYSDHSVRTLTIAPSQDLFEKDSNKLGDAIGVELAKLGYSVVDENQATELLAKYDISPVHIFDPSALAALQKEGIDAVLWVSSATSSIGGPDMRHVTVRLTSTSTSKKIGEIDWHNAWGGMPGSPADYTMRKGVTAAAREIAEALAKLLG